MAKGKLLSSFLRVTMSNYILLKNNIERSQKAYELYKNNANYHHALHIYHANKVIYEELNKLLNSKMVDVSFKNKVYNYIFHLEDWFLQFHLHEKQVSELEDKFAFAPLEFNIPFPANFVEDL